jgi:hypothetical protein
LEKKQKLKEIAPKELKIATKKKKKKKKRSFALCHTATVQR